MLKPELQIKLLQHLNSKKKADEGFTLIELLVVIIIIGVLAAIALPSLLNQVNKARQSEARQNVGALNRGQQAYFLENSNNFSTSIGDLGIGIKSQTQNYLYEIVGQVEKGVTNKGRARQPKLKSYAGIVYTIDQSVQSSSGSNITESLTQGVLCESENPNGGPKDTPEPVSDATIPGGNVAPDCPTAISQPKMKTIK